MTDNDDPRHNSVDSKHGSRNNDPEGPSQDDDELNTFDERSGFNGGDSDYRIDTEEGETYDDDSWSPLLPDSSEDELNEELYDWDEDESLPVDANDSGISSSDNDFSGDGQIAENAGTPTAAPVIPEEALHEQTPLEPNLIPTTTDALATGADHNSNARERPAAANPAERQSWPMGMILVAVFALALLAAGGYGVIQQRAAAQEEIRQLRSALAVAAVPAQVDASQTALKEARQQVAELQQAVDALTLEKRRLDDTVAGLEHQLEAIQTVPSTTPATETTATGTATAFEAGAALAPAVTTTPTQKAGSNVPPIDGAGGTWFVNLGSYSQRAMAESWVRKLHPQVGQAVVTSATNAGKNIYRVRVVGLTDRDTATRVARQLQLEFHLDKPWVGRE